MVFKVSEVSGIFDRYYGDFESVEGLFWVSFLSFGESLVGGMILRFKWLVVCVELLIFLCGLILLLFFILLIFFVKVLVVSVSFVSLKFIFIVV